MNVNFSQNLVIALINFVLYKDSERNLFFNYLYIDIRALSNKWEDFELLIYHVIWPTWSYGNLGERAEIGM